MACGLVGDGELVGSHGQAAPLFEPVDAPFDRIALPLCLGIKSGRATAGAASPQTVTDLAGRLRDDGTDSAPTEMTAHRTGRIRAISQDGLRSGSRSSESASRNPHACHRGLEGRCDTSLARSDVEGQGPCLTVAGEMDFRPQAAAGASEPVIVRFGPAR
ncbi:hypothetical protein GCM10010365_67740 [Streptomyces poonensis]|uniref:Uncharacterized protein n=1 Tax=Streptomyces poonensis TaxID=68255 RepID=A0A918Q844_9ACTN|nr:hypothetical protein GCM10010365_67740 [Streptomyces poonensis]GLJ91166.1 hypothetical protein GCM10017589_37720 [Streptomyces poonensis]